MTVGALQRDGAASGASRRPIRTCAGCRTTAAQDSLLRVALVEGRPVADPRRRLSGRGAYVHPGRACVERAVFRGGLARSFRTQLPSPAAADPMAWLRDASPAMAGAELWDRDDERS